MQTSAEYGGRKPKGNPDSRGYWNVFPNRLSSWKIWGIFFLLTRVRLTGAALTRGCRIFPPLGGNQGKKSWLRQGATRGREWEGRSLIHPRKQKRLWKGQKKTRSLRPDEVLERVLFGGFFSFLRMSEVRGGIRIVMAAADHSIKEKVG